MSKDRNAQLREVEFQRIRALVQEGYAGTLQGGLIVDRREHPEAVPMQKNAMLGVPEPAQAQPCGGYYCTEKRHRDCPQKTVADDFAFIEEERIIDRGQL